MDMEWTASEHYQTFGFHYFNLNFLRNCPEVVRYLDLIGSGIFLLQVTNTETAVIVDLVLGVTYYFRVTGGVGVRFVPAYLDNIGWVE